MVIVSDIHFYEQEPKQIPDEFDLVLKNGGRSVAIINDVFATPRVGRDREHALPPEPGYVRVEYKFVAPPIFPGETQPVYMGGGTPIPYSNASVERFKRGDFPLSIYGMVLYESAVDNFSGCGVTGFCFRYVPLEERRGSKPQFVTCHEPDYTYTKQCQQKCADISAPC